MRSLAFSIALWFCIAGVLLQSATAQKGTFQITNGVIEYQHRQGSLRTVEFKNLTYSLGGDAIALRNGRFSQQNEGIGGIDAELDHVWFFDLKDGIPRHALVSIDVVRYGGSSSPTGYVLLFEMRGEKLVSTEQIEYDSQAPGTGASFDTSRSELKVTARSDDNTPNCCPTHVDTISLQWKDDQFQQAGFQTKRIHK